MRREHMLQSSGKVVFKLSFMYGLVDLMDSTCSSRFHYLKGFEEGSDFVAKRIFG